MWFLIKFMFKTVLAIAVVALAFAMYGIYTARALPDWFDETQADVDHANTAVHKQLNDGGVELLANKAMDVLRGKVAFTESEFNALFLASLKADADGRKLLSVSDGVRVFLHRDKVEISAIINLEKLAKVEPKAREAVDKFDKLFWIVEDNRLAVTVYGTPVARRGGLGVKDDFYAKVGQLEFSNETLRSMKVPVERANRTQLEIEYLHLKSVTVNPSDIVFGVQAKL